MRTGVRVWVGLGCLLLGGLGWGQTAAVPAAEIHPALWKVTGAHGVVYLFGTIHVMKPGVKWETGKVAEALKASDTLYLEVPDLSEEGMKALQPTVLQMGLDVMHPLSTKMTKEDVALLDAAAKGMGLPGEAAVEPMQPWLVAMTLAVAPAIKAGYGTDTGIDKTLAGDAVAAKKPVKGFETVMEQMHMLADMPQEEQVQMLHQTLADLPKNAEKVDVMVADWERGDVEKIAAMENDEMKEKYPALYKRLLVERNERFATALAGLLKDEHTGTLFVAIGAAHLAGPDSVQVGLAKLGYTAVRQ